MLLIAAYKLIFIKFFQYNKIMAAEISEQKLLKKLMRISDSYYKTLYAKTCVTNLNDALENPTTLKIMDFDYHKGLIYFHSKINIAFINIRTQTDE